MASPSLAVRPGLSSASLDALIQALGEGAVEAEVRRTAFAQFEALPTPGGTPGRYWRYDLRKLDYATVVPYSSGLDNVPVLVALAGVARGAWFTQVDSHVTNVEIAPELAGRGVVVTSLAEAKTHHATLFERAFGRIVRTGADKFASLALAFQSGGAFVYVPRGVQIDEPLLLTYAGREAALFPYTLVYVEEGARVTVIEHLLCDGASDFVSGITEVVAEARAQVTFASLQETCPEARVFTYRRSSAGADARVSFALSETGADFTHSDVLARNDDRGAHASVAALFFADGKQHVDLTTEVDHRVPDTSSDTVVKSAATGNGQARYFGNIRIHAHAHGSEATLRDDALLLSQTSHIDSIPALEIAANDVKAFHGATVGAIDAEQIFYAMSRGVTRSEAERLIALGFFEPAIALFPGEAVRTHVRAAIESKILTAAGEDGL